MSAPALQREMTAGALLPALDLALVAWSGAVGGAEIFASDLAIALRAQGVGTGVLLVGSDGPVTERLDRAGIRRLTLGLRRGSHVLAHPRRIAVATTALGPDGVILQADGFLAAALRAGGYHGKIVAVQHGELLHRPWLSRRRRTLRALDQASGVRAIDALVAVSDAALAAVVARRSPPRTLRIYNGVDLERFRPRLREPRRSPVTIGFAGRLVPGKGVDVLLQALARMEEHSARALVAGGGPRRAALEELSRRLGLGGRVAFLGPQDDMPGFWSQCDVAAVPSHPPLVESFGLTAVEAMACGVPVIASDSGGLPEVVVNGRTGAIVPSADPGRLAAALDVYVRNPRLLEEHGREARARCERRFGIDRSAQAYIQLFRSLRGDDRPGLAPGRKPPAAAASTAPFEG